MTPTILVPLAEDFVEDPAFEAAFSLAEPLAAHVRPMFIRPDAAEAAAYIPEVVAAAGVTRESIDGEGRAAAQVARQHYEDCRSRYEVVTSETDRKTARSPGEGWTEAIGDIEQLVTYWGRLSDLIIMSRFGASDVTAGRCFDAAVFGTGRPTMIVATPLPSDMLKHVLIAWNGSVEASRSLFAALPLLQCAARISILSVPQPGLPHRAAEDLTNTLAWHGVPAAALPNRAGPVPPGPALMTALHECDASLVVMGAYTHSRLRQHLLGGVTQKMLYESPVPVLMCH